MTTIYFAHPYTEWNSDQAKKIEQILLKQGYQVINPFNQKEKRLMEHYGGTYYDKVSQEFARDIVEGDLNMIKEADEYLGWFPPDCMSIGASIELHFASVHNKRIKVICGHPHPFLYILSDEFYKGIDEFKKQEDVVLPHSEIERYKINN